MIGDTPEIGISDCRPEGFQWTIALAANRAGNGAMAWVKDNKFYKTRASARAAAKRCLKRWLKETAT